MKRFLAVLLAAFFAVTAVAAAAIAGTYSGTTAQHRVIRVQLSATEMVSAHYKAVYTCRKGTRVTHSAPQVTDLPPTNWSQGRAGHIDARYRFLLGTNHRPDNVHFVASINRRGHLVGWFNETYTSFGFASCHSGTVYFNITHQ